MLCFVCAPFGTARKHRVKNRVFSIARTRCIETQHSLFQFTVVFPSWVSRVRVASCFVRDEPTSEPTIRRTRVCCFAHTLLTRDEFV